MFKIFSSSAGSGKTYTLTKEYLKLALRDRAESEKEAFQVFQFKHILAVTFTNAAANEMKERILKELERIANSHPDSMLKTIAAEAELATIEPATIQKRAKEVFHAILHDYSSFSVLTIDSFVQRVVSAFTDDLELPYTFEVEMETESVLQTAIERLLEKVGQEDHKYLSEAIEEFYLEKAADGKSWNGLAGTLVEFSRNQLGDRNYDFVRRLADLDPKDFRQIRAQLIEKRKVTEPAICAIAQTALGIIDQAGLKTTDFLQGGRGVGGYFEKKAKEHKYDEGAGSYALQALEGDTWFGKAATPITRAKLEGIKADLIASHEQIEKLRNDYILFNLLEQHLQKISLLKQIKQECDELLREQNRVHISEFNRLILKVVANEPVPFVYERLGEKYHHILIDEFQDTSRLQFVNLLPLIENNLGYERFNLAVGDAKQAIYRFRGGDMDQIVALHRKKLDNLLLANADSQMTQERLFSLSPYLNPDRLATNWRSAESIVQFNNDFFGFLAEQYQGTEYEQVTEVFDAEFKQAASKVGIRGHVQLDFFEKPEKGEDDAVDLGEQMAVRTLELIEKAKAEGYRYSDIAILCRFKKNARLLADFLEKNKIPLTSEDSLTLMSSERVRFLTCVMQLLHQPDNKLVRYELLFLYHRLVKPDVSVEQLTNHIDERAKSDDMYQLFSYISSPITKETLEPLSLTQLSVYELAEKLALYYNLFDNERDCAYLFRFLDEVLTFSARFSSHLADFLVYWETAQDKISVTAPADSDAVTITTIHKSKGLEYPVVIVPFADWSSKPRNNDTMWMDLSDMDELDALVCPPTEDIPMRRLMAASVTLKKDLVDTPLSLQYHDELYRTFVECMNMLYVAFTRPTDRLYILSTKNKYEAKDGKPINREGIDFWLFNYLNDLRGGACWQEGQLSYSLHKCQTVPSRKQTKTTAGNPLAVAAHSREGNRSLQLRRLSDAMQADFEQSREWGQKLCTALALVKTPDCIEQTIRRMVAEGRLRAAEADQLKAALEQTIAHPELAALYVPGLRSDGNRPVLLPKGNKKGGLHRVVHLPGKVILVNYQDDETATESHQSTLRSFVKLYQQMGHEHVEGRVVYVTPVVKVLTVSQ
ncbi:UvrD-helicase domain-containing protein [Tellurirhabdus bombi]|uniref:UvrD-helicase domain-containing protein n=1 Tax=Tellurirhabdus bombi TaxID=2907205 RepID=UPI001F218D79|nr:UvrD-helicase domain-containing protein [Tellurirhabdus bombi]